MDDKIQYGLITTDKETSLSKVSEVLRRAVSELLLKFKPDVVLIEDTYLRGNVAVLKRLELCRTVVKLECYRALNYWPLEVWTQEYRSPYGLKTKEDAFKFITNRLNLDLNFEDHNDIADAALMGLYAEDNNLVIEKIFSGAEKEFLIGITISKNSKVSNNRIITTSNEKETILKYNSIPSFVLSPIYYCVLPLDKNLGVFKRECNFEFEKVDNLKFTLNSLYFLFLDSFYRRGKFLYSDVNMNVAVDFSKLEIPVKLLKNSIRIDHKIFLDSILPHLKKSFGRKEAARLQEKIK